MKFRAVLFDLDGTLLDTLEDLAESMNGVLAALGFPTHPREAYKQFVGDGVESLARRTLPEGHRDGPVLARCVAGMRQEYGRRWAERTRPYDGIPQLLAELTRRKVVMAVLSNKPDDLTRLVVQRLLPNWRFQAVMGAREGQARKPDPGAALEIARRLDVPPAEFLYLGDTNTDMRTALAAGMHAAGALWGFRTAEELTASGAAVLIRHPMDLLDLL